MGKVKNKTISSALEVNMTKSEIQKPKDSLTEFKKNTVTILQRLERENFDKELDIDNLKDATHYLQIDRDKIKEKNRELEARNKFLEETHGDKRIKEIHKEIKQDHRGDDWMEERIDIKANEKYDLFKKLGIQKYLDDPKISNKKKRN